MDKFISTFTQHVEEDVNAIEYAQRALIEIKSLEDYEKYKKQIFEIISGVKNSLLILKDLAGEQTKKEKFPNENTINSLGLRYNYDEYLKNIPEEPQDTDKNNDNLYYQQQQRSPPQVTAQQTKGLNFDYSKGSLENNTRPIEQYRDNTTQNQPIPNMNLNYNGYTEEHYKQQQGGYQSQFIQSKQPSEVQSKFNTHQNNSIFSSYQSTEQPQQYYVPTRDKDYNYPIPEAYNKYNYNQNANNVNYISIVSQVSPQTISEYQPERERATLSTQPQQSQYTQPPVKQLVNPLKSQGELGKNVSFVNTITQESIEQPEPQVSPQPAILSSPMTNQESGFVDTGTKKQKISRVADLISKINSDQELYEMIIQLYGEGILDELMSSKVDESVIETVEKTVKEIERLREKDAKEQNEQEEKIERYEKKEYIDRKEPPQMRTISATNQSSFPPIPEKSFDKSLNKSQIIQPQKKSYADELLASNGLLNKYPKSSKIPVPKSNNQSFRHDGEKFDFEKSLRFDRSTPSKTRMNSNNKVHHQKKFVNYTSSYGNYFDQSLQNGGVSKLPVYPSKYKKRAFSPVREYINSKNPYYS